MTRGHRDADKSAITAVGIAQTDYALRTRYLIKLINELRGVGAHADLDLPRIAVIGNQSAGKSSLVEAISGITVPRASGTCTRCPMECRLQNSADPWKCQVLLRFERDENGEPNLDVREVKFGPVLTDESQLEEMLRRAQLAVLNPSVPHASFVDLDTSKLIPGEPILGTTQKSLQFSSNVVAFDLSGPDTADLSFIDLPGIISNVAEGEDRNNIKLVQDLVKDHIKGNSLILLTLTMRDDLENQSAAFLAKEADPDGMRTIGVLTKPDTIQHGEESTWIEVLQGRRHNLKKVYYITKQPGPNELVKRSSFEESRRQEKEFFASTEPWKSSTAHIKSRTGIPKLTAELSRLLSHLIMHTLPKLRDDARKAHITTLNALKKLPPPPPENPVVELLRLLTMFSTETRKWTDGAEQTEGLVQVLKTASEGFKSNILQTAPNFLPFKNAEEQKEIQQSHDDSTNDNNMTPPVFLLDVRTYIAKSIGRELPYNVPFSAKRGLIEKSFKTWEDHAMAFFEDICQATTKKLNDLIDDYFSRFALSPLKDHVKDVVDKEINHYRQVTQERSKWFLKLEHPPFTQNHHYLSSLREKYLSSYMAARKTQSFDQNALSKTLSQLALLGFEGLSADDLHKLNKASEFEEELIVMAEVSAYCCVAQKRIIDDLPRIVDHDFIQALGEHIQDALVNAFGIGTEKAIERATMYLAEDPNDLARREELEAKAQRLEEVLSKLFNFAL